MIIWKKIRIFFDLIKFEHTVFALPFAYLGLLLASQDRFSIAIWGWVTLAMVSARTAAMCLNRLVDLRIDEKNPRTQKRPLVTGDFSVFASWVVVGVSLALFVLSVSFLNMLCLKLAPIALFLLWGYHYVKRFSFLSHFVLGLVLAIAPMGGWIAATGAFSWVPLQMSVGVLFWVAGFDILYSLQDLEFDQAQGLHSIPVRFGQAAALQIARVCHLLSVAFFISFGVVMGLGVLYWVGIGTIATLFVVEHRIISTSDLRQINTAFFTVNSWIGILLLIFTFLETFR